MSEIPERNKKRYHSPRRRKKIAPQTLVFIILIAVVVISAAVLFITRPAWLSSFIKGETSFTLIKAKSSSGDGTVSYLASEGDMITLYTYTTVDTDEGKTEKMVATDLILPRGTEVANLNKTVMVDIRGQINSKSTKRLSEYSLIEYEGEKYYVRSASLVESYDEIMKESVKFVRTSVTVYENSSGPEIKSFIKKGTQLQIVGWDKLNEDGSVRMYEVTGNDALGEEVTGWVYSKYLVDSLADAVAVNEDYYNIHKDRSYSYELHGGSPTSIDYFPYEKADFEDNPIMEEARGMYLNASSLEELDDYIALAKESGVNTMVVDIKDGYVCVELETTKEQCPSAYSMASYTAEEYKAFIDKIKDAGFYAIGRIVVFNDSQFGADHPETSLISDYLSSWWPSAYSREAWYYNVCMAIECVETFGFNEIQFDYIRFPEESYKMSEDEDSDFKNEYDEEKVEVLQNFLYYACDQIHETGAYLSIDVFGECVDTYVTAYGQYWPALSNIADAISGMPYTDHFGTTDTWSDPYTTVYNWAKKATLRQSEIPTPAIARTWITGYNVPNWGPYITYGEDELITQAQALYDGGLSGGFIPWNGSSNINNYTSYAAVWGNDYVE